MSIVSGMVLDGYQLDNLDRDFNGAYNALLRVFKLRHRELSKSKKQAKKLMCELQKTKREVFCNEILSIRQFTPLKQLFAKVKSFLNGLYNKFPYLKTRKKFPGNVNSDEEKRIIKRTAFRVIA